MDRNLFTDNFNSFDRVALRKESVDRNSGCLLCAALDAVALRKESVDRNVRIVAAICVFYESLSARRAWIEISVMHCG